MLRRYPAWYEENADDGKKESGFSVNVNKSLQ